MQLNAYLIEAVVPHYFLFYYPKKYALYNAIVEAILYLRRPQCHHILVFSNRLYLFLQSKTPLVPSEGDSGDEE